MEIKVLGPGCPNCEKLEQDVMELITELKLAADLEHVRDPVAISGYGVMGSVGGFVAAAAVTVSRAGANPPWRNELA